MQQWPRPSCARTLTRGLPCANSRANSLATHKRPFSAWNVPHNSLACVRDPSDECGHRGHCRERIETMKIFTIDRETKNITLHASVQEAEAIPNAESFRTEAEFSQLA